MFYYFSMILTFGTNQTILLKPTAKATDALFCPSTGAKAGNEGRACSTGGACSTLLQPGQAAWQLPCHGMGNLCSAPSSPGADCLHQEILLKCNFSALASHTSAFPPRGAQHRSPCEDTRGHLSQLWQINMKSWVSPSTPTAINLEERSCTAKKHYTAQREILMLKWILSKNCKTTGFEAAVST